MKNTKNVIKKKKFFKIYKTDDDKLSNNNHIAFRYLCFNHIENIRSIEIPEFSQGNKYETVFIEFRKFPHVELLIRNTILKLDYKWSHTVICGNTNYKLMKKICKKISPNIKILKTDYDNLKPSEYSKFLASMDFWDLLQGEKILIYQEDSFIFKDNIDDFLEFDFIGAPFPKSENDTPNSVGNGGLSLRSKSIMKKVINTIGIDETNLEDSTLNYMTLTNSFIPPEDVYFSKNMQELKIGNLLADTDYTVICYTTDTLQHTMPLIVAQKTALTITTKGFRSTIFTQSYPAVFEMSFYTSNFPVFAISLTAKPRNSVEVMLSLNPIICQSSKLINSIIANSSMIVPNTFKFKIFRANMFKFEKC